MNYADIIDVTENSALFGYELDAPGFAVLTIDGREIKSVEAGGTGRFRVSGLAPETSYHAELSGVGLDFTTLPAPEGPELYRFAVISDPHISAKEENRKGRFFVESAALAAESFAAACKLGAEFAVLPGDITNEGTEEEYRISRGVLARAELPVYVLPGNHDHPERGYWERFCGPRSWKMRLRDCTWIGADTSDKRLHEEDARAIREAVESGERVIVFSHYQLFEAPRINHKPNQAVGNREENGEVLELIRNSPVMLYVGHQNICSCAPCGRALQLNLPQTPQFPCAWILVRVFANGFYHQQIPIASEVMRQWSRRAGNEAAAFYGEPQWRGEYRMQSYEQSNFVWRG